MSKRFAALTLAALLICMSGLISPGAFAQQPQPPGAGAAETARDEAAQDEAAQDEAARKVKRKVAEFGTGPRAKVEVRLRDGRKLRGNISEIDDAHFTVVDSKTKGATDVAYSEVKSLKNRYIPQWMKITSIVAIGVMGPVLVAAAITVARGGQ